MLNRRVEFCLHEILSSKNNPTISIHITSKCCHNTLFLMKGKTGYQARVRMGLGYSSHFPYKSHSH